MFSEEVAVAFLRGIVVIWTIAIAVVSAGRIGRHEGKDNGILGDEAVMEE